MLLNNPIVKIKYLTHFDRRLPVPAYQTIGAAGADICVSLEDQGQLIIKPGERLAVPTGLSFEIPQGYEMQVRPRSGLSLKTSILLVNSPGTIDYDYRGEVKILVGNFGSVDYVIEHGMRIAQLVLAPILQANFMLSDVLTDTARGEGGFGSTGLKA